MVRELKFAARDSAYNWRQCKIKPHQDNLSKDSLVTFLFFTIRGDLSEQISTDLDHRRPQEKGNIFAVLFYPTTRY